MEKRNKKRENLARKIQEVPEHYKSEISPLDFMKANGIAKDFCKGNIIKYVFRYEKKNGLEDLYKARTYLDYLIDIESK